MFNTTTVSDGSKSLKGIYKNLVKLVNRNEKHLGCSLSIRWTYGLY